MVGWRVLAISRVAKRSRSLKRLGGSVSSSSWEAERVFYVLATRARTCGYNELHFGGGRKVKHQRSFGVQCYKTFISVDVLKQMNGNQSFVMVFGVDPGLR